jgi:hypothetical protein
MNCVITVDELETEEYFLLTVPVGLVYLINESPAAAFLHRQHLVEICPAENMTKSLERFCISSKPAHATDWLDLTHIMNFNHDSHAIATQTSSTRESPSENDTSSELLP